MEKTGFKKLRKYIHQNKEVKEKQYPLSFIYVKTTFEHQVQDMYASQKIQVYSSLRRLKTHFRHPQGHQRASAITDSNCMYSKQIYYSERIRTSKDSLHIKKLGEWTSWFSEVIKVLFHHYL